MQFFKNKNRLLTFDVLQRESQLDVVNLATGKSEAQAVFPLDEAHHGEAKRAFAQVQSTSKALALLVTEDGALTFLSINPSTNSAKGKSKQDTRIS